MYRNLCFMICIFFLFSALGYASNLPYLIQNGKREQAMRKIEKGKDLNYINEKGNTAFYYAVTSGDAELTNLLLQKKVNITLGNNPLPELAGISSKKISIDYKIRIFELYFSNNILSDDTSIREAFQNAVTCRDSILIIYLLKKNVKPSSESLAFAISNDYNILRLLLDNGGDANSIIKFGGNLRKVWLLNGKRTYKNPPFSGFSESENITIKVSSDEIWQTDYIEEPIVYKSLLLIAFEKKKDKIFDLLIAHGADINWKSNTDDTSILEKINERNSDEERRRKEEEQRLISFRQTGDEQIQNIPNKMVLVEGGISKWAQQAFPSSKNRFTMYLSVLS
jgi:hypothetical protein